MKFGKPGKVRTLKGANLLSTGQGTATELIDFVENAPMPMHWVDRDGIIVWTNQAELDLLGYQWEEYVGHPITEFHADSEVIADILRRLAAGETLNNYEARLRHKDGSIKHVLISSNVRWENGQFLHSRCFTRDITERKRAEVELALLNTSLEQRVAERTATVQLLQDIAIAANEAQTVEAAFRFALQRICTHTGWPIGHVYLPANDIDGLEPSDIWHLVEPEQFEAFRQASSGTSFTAGAGLPGLVLATRQPAWMADVTVEPNFPRVQAALASGIKAGFAFPIWAGEEIVAVMEFFSSQVVSPDESLLAVLPPIGVQLGRVVERQRAENNLRDNQIMFQALFESAPDAKVIVDASGRIVQVNTQAETMFDYQRAELVGRPVEILLPEAFQKQHARHRAAYQARPQIRPMGIGLDLFGRRQDGATFPVDVMLSPVRLADQRLVISAIRDKSDRQQAEAEIRESERQFAEAQAIAHLGSWQWDIASNEVTWSDELYRIYGLRPQEIAITYHGFLERVHPDDREQVEGTVLAAYQDGHPFSFEHRIIRPDGVVRTLQAQGKVILDKDGRPSRMVGTGLDITERKENEAHIQQLNAELEQRVAERTAQLEAANRELQAEVTERRRIETALEAQRLFLRQIIDVNPNFVFAKDRQGRFTLVNQAVAIAYGSTVEDLIGKSDADFNPNVAEVEHFRRDDLEVIETGREKFIPEERITDVSGQVRWLQTVKRPIAGPDGAVNQLLGVATDITLRKQVEQQLEASLHKTEQLLKEKEVLLKEVHHRVKNNLQAVSNLLYLQLGHIQDPATRQIFRETQDRIKSIALIHEKLYQAADLAQLDFAEYLRSVTANLIQSYTVDPTAICLEVAIDPVRMDVDTAIPLGLIVNELVSNSLKHAFPAGRQPGGQGDEIRIELSIMADRQVRLLVADNGIGLPEKIDLNNVDSLGLQLVHLLTQHMDGTIEIERRGGTTFAIKWPLAED